MPTDVTTKAKTRDTSERLVHTSSRQDSSLGDPLSGLTDPLDASSVQMDKDQSTAGNVSGTAINAMKAKYLLASKALGMSSNPVGPGLAVAGGINTALTHEPSSSGGMGVVENMAVGGSEAAFGVGALSQVGGVPLMADMVSGGNTSGVIKGGAAAITSSISALSGDTEANDQFQEKVFSGEYGAATGGIGVTADLLAQGASALLSPGDQELDTSAMEQFSESMQNGSSLNPMTHLANFGAWSGGKMYDLFNDE